MFPKKQNFNKINKINSITILKTILYSKIIQSQLKIIANMDIQENNILQVKKN